MAELGDKVSVRSGGKARVGVVTAAGGSMLRIRWELGGETSIAPGPGTLKVLRKARKRAAAPAAAPAKKKAAVKKAPVKEACGEEGTGPRTRPR